MVRANMAKATKARMVSREVKDNLKCLVAASEAMIKDNSFANTSTAQEVAVMPNQEAHAAKDFMLVQDPVALALTLQ